MEPNAWARFIQFIKSSFQEKFKAFMPGCVMGFIGAEHLLFSGIAVSVVDYILKYIGTVIMAFSSGLATAYASYLIDKHKENGKKRQKKRQSDKAA